MTVAFGKKGFYTSYKLEYHNFVRKPPESPREVFLELELHANGPDNEQAVA